MKDQNYGNNIKNIFNQKKFKMTIKLQLPSVSNDKIWKEKNQKRVVNELIKLIKRRYFIKI